MATETNKGPKRPHPAHTLAEALVVARKIRDEKAGRPISRLLLADALGIKATSSNFRDLLSSSLKYGLTEGSHNVNTISLTTLGEAATGTDAGRKTAALREAAQQPKLFRSFYEAYDQNRLPSGTMISKVLVTEFEVPEPYAEDCGRKLVENGRFVGILRSISGVDHVMLAVDDDVEFGLGISPTGPAPEGDVSELLGEERPETSSEISETATAPSIDRSPKAIFIGHGKSRVPLEKIQKQLGTFQIPHKVVVNEPNLGRPIPTKVRQTMQDCGSAILIFTKDEKYFDEDGAELWRPSENVVFELGAASYLYEDRVVILKEKGVTFPTNFNSIGYIEFEGDAIEAKWMEVLQELIGFGLVKLTTS